ncbi:histidine phosphatase family protein [Demequina aurantiaca]|uniref:histidine phosphatase family protein n=1 Tax=Demequina aurantiaca TaxID=676200 RepID=UPI00078200AA|nr:histidine phosphatase family protein [Demequina aurantiaca]
MTQVYIVRHGQTDWNVEGRLQGSSNTSLNDTGREQARHAASTLGAAVREGVVVVSSPLDRTRETADIIAAQWGSEIHTDQRLVERDYGPWEGLTADEREQFDPLQHKAWRAGREPEYEGYENHATVGARMVEGILHWVEQAPDDLLIVTHGSSARMAILHLLELEVAGRRVGNLENAAWSRLVQPEGGGWSLDRHNIGAE